MSAEGFEPRNRLEVAMDGARQGTCDAAEFFAVLAAARIYIPQHARRQGRPALVDLSGPARRVRLPVLDRGGRLQVPVFSSEVRLRRFAPESRACLNLPVLSLARRWHPAHWMAINPGSEFGLELTPGDVRWLAGRVPAGRSRPPRGRAVEEEEAPAVSVVVGEANRSHQAVLEGLAAHLRGEPSVRAAYGAEMIVEGPRRPAQILVAVETEPLAGGARSRLTVRAVKAAGVLGGAPVGFLLMEDGRPPNPIGAHLVEQGEPFYRRARDGRGGEVD